MHLAIAFEGYFRRRLTWWERLLFAATALLFFFQIWWLKVAAVALLGLGVAVQNLYRSGELTSAPLVRPGE